MLFDANITYFQLLPVICLLRRCFGWLYDVDGWWIDADYASRHISYADIRQISWWPHFIAITRWWYYALLAAGYWLGEDIAMIADERWLRASH